MPSIRLFPEQDMSYPAARGPVLLLSCMDLRLLNETVEFMDHDGLNNRYDHVILAGAAYGALGGPGARDEQGKSIDLKHWKQTFEDHLAAAYKLHHIKDVYILEHRDCGAYRVYLGADGDFDDDQAVEEAACHKKFTDLLTKQIQDWATLNHTKIRVKSFLMDLRGKVELLGSSRKSKKK